MSLHGARSATSGEAEPEKAIPRTQRKGGDEMKRLILAVAVAVVIVLTAKYFGLLSGPVILGGQVSSLVPAGPVALVGGTLLDGTGGTPLRNSVVLINRERIEK